MAGRTAAGRPGRFLLVMLLVAGGTIVLAWCVSAFGAAGFLDPEYGLWVVKRQMVAACNVGSTVALGDSRVVAAVVPAELGDTTNLALGTATPLEMYFVARRLTACRKPPRRVLLNFSPQDLRRDDYYWARPALFGFLSFAELEEARATARAFHDTTLYRPPTVWDLDAKVRDWLYAHAFPSFYLDSMWKGGLVMRLATYRRVYTETRLADGHVLYLDVYGDNGSADQPADEAVAKTFRVSPLLDYYLTRMLLLFEQTGTQVVLIAPPWNQATCEKLHPAFVAGYDAYLHTLEREFPGIISIGPAVECYPNRLFSDAYHLNAAGASLFSRRLSELLPENRAAMAESGENDARKE
jgi:hypothetical protein